MGSPDPDGRQIDGLGGGISSLSKAAVVSFPGEPAYIYERLMKDSVDSIFGPQSTFPGWEWEGGVAHADDVRRAYDPVSGWDVVYRFAQVGVRDSVVDWGSTCGNLVAAVAQFAVDSGVLARRLPPSVARGNPDVSRMRVPERPHSTRLYTTRILAADTGKIVRATFPIRDTIRGWRAYTEGDTSIAGVPGTSSAIHIETPLTTDVLPTGNQLDYVSLDEEQIPCSVVHAGLPCIFVPAASVIPQSSDLSSLDPEELLTLTPSELDSNLPLGTRLESIRRAAGHQFPALVSGFSGSQPKICVVGPPDSCFTTSGDYISADSIDCAIRAVSVGNFHRTVPATMLSALAVARALPGTVVAQACPPTSTVLDKTSGKTTITVRVGQPAGVSEASVVLDSSGNPTSILYVRTARCIMRGDVYVPHSILSS